MQVYFYILYCNLANESVTGYNYWRHFKKFRVKDCRGLKNAAYLAHVKFIRYRAQAQMLDFCEAVKFHVRKCRHRRVARILNTLRMLKNDATSLCCSETAKAGGIR